ncbi:MAG: nucleotidyltransferase domain-containing protein [Betaproteobacteria bacterium]|nr:nucleotidyltransferase domain-containing protein [Betaproteobacteria bacterium]
MKITAAKIRALSRRIAEQFNPDRIILFGSRAHGRPHADSDVDLLVVMRCDGAGARKAVEILNRVEPEFAVDLIVRTPQEMRRRLGQQDSFLAEVVRHGKVLYEAAHA